MLGVVLWMLPLPPSQPPSLSAYVFSLGSAPLCSLAPLNAAGGQGGQGCSVLGAGWLQATLLSTCPAAASPAHPHTCHRPAAAVPSAAGKQSHAKHAEKDPQGYSDRQAAAGERCWDAGCCTRTHARTLAQPYVAVGLLHLPPCCPHPCMLGVLLWMLPLPPSQPPSIPSHPSPPGQLAELC